MKRLTKKDLALSLHSAGRSTEEIARVLHTHPSYVARILADAGKTCDYSDLYTPTNMQNAYARQFAGVLRFRDVEAAAESVARIDRLFREYAEMRDRRGMHQAQMLALTGKNRAEGIGKMEEAKAFGEWLTKHLYDTADLTDRIPPAPKDFDYDENNLYELNELVLRAA